MFVCPICKKDFKTLKEYATHINGEQDKSESEAKMRAEKEREEKLRDKENQIKELYEKLKTSIKEYNSIEDGSKIYLLSMYSREKQKSEDKKDFFDLFMNALGM